MAMATFTLCLVSRSNPISFVLSFLLLLLRPSLSQNNPGSCLVNFSADCSWTNRNGIINHTATSHVTFHVTSPSSSPEDSATNATNTDNVPNVYYATLIFHWGSTDISTGTAAYFYDSSITVSQSYFPSPPFGFVEKAGYSLIFEKGEGGGDICWDRVRDQFYWIYFGEGGGCDVSGKELEVGGSSGGGGVSGIGSGESGGEPSSSSAVAPPGPSVQKTPQPPTSNNAPMTPSIATNPQTPQTPQATPSIITSPMAPTTPAPNAIISNQASNATIIPAIDPSNNSNNANNLNPTPKYTWEDLPTQSPVVRPPMALESSSGLRLSSLARFEKFVSLTFGICVAMSGIV